MISKQQVGQFLQDGAVTLDTPFSEHQIQAAAAALDRIVPLVPAQGDNTQRYRFGATCSYFDAELLDLIQHPWLEEVSSAVVGAHEVTLLQTAIIATYPQPEGPFSFDQHVDMQYTHTDLNATPRRIVCSFFLWLTDVTPTRAPMMHRPGTHLALSEHWGSVPGLQNEVPRVKGIPLADLPQLAFPPAQPVLARAGQVTALTTAMVHGASVNLDTEPRKALVITFAAKGVHIGLPETQQQTKDLYDSQLLTRLRPERRHLVQRQGA